MDGFGIYAREMLRHQNKPFKKSELFFEELQNTEKYEEITEDWLNAYHKIGCCLLLSHYEGLGENSNDRFENIGNNTRRCKWCGKQQYLQHKLVDKYIWVS